MKNNKKTSTKKKLVDLKVSSFCTQIALNTKGGNNDGDNDSDGESKIGDCTLEIFCF